ncbi:MAG: 6-phosphogluconolactonase [Miltoncostaeaceae bacterium]|jgi:6-phosphogluconolactonase|nr:6-phosphogluconolactonase [Miltoncostaeaceae bacterium]
MPSPEVVVVPDAAALAREAADQVARVIAGGSPDRPAAVALSGGSTPRGAYERLAAAGLPWDRAELFFSDERLVPPDHPASNVRMVREALLDPAGVAPERVHRIRGELPPWTAAALAEAELRATRPGRWPALDLVLLGIGEDGHTASLFPGAPELAERSRAVVPVHRSDLPQPWRATMTLPALNAAHAVLILADGAAKAAVVRRAIAGDPALPAGLVRPAGRLTWLVTEAAAGELS